MKKRALFVVAVAALLSVGLYGVSSRAPVVHAATIGFQHTSGPVAIASFTRSISSGAVQYGDVFATDTSLQTQPGKAIKGPSVGVSVVEFNGQSEIPSFAAFGQAPVSGLQIDGKKLTSAFLPLTSVTLDVVNPLNGQPTGQTVIAHVEVSWTGTGDVTRDSFVSHFRAPGYFEITKGSGIHRSASAVAEVFDVTVPGGPSFSFDGQSSEFGELANTKFMDHVIMR